ncbi:MAG: sulfatase [Planctomycetes bacterium]|nr:sulfatase [Planctomycetota bacterium]
MMAITRRDFVKMTGGIAALLVSGCGETLARKQTKQPNIMWLISEDNSVHYCNLYNDAGVNMPNVNKLAETGVIFNHAFSNCPVCSAARSTLITGCYGSRIATQYHRKLEKTTLLSDLEILPAHLKRAGYHTSYKNKTDFNFNYSEDVWDSRKDWAGHKPDQPFFHQHQFPITHEGRLQKSGRDGEDNKSVALPPYFPNTAVFRKTINTYHQRHRTLDIEIGEVIERLRREGVLEDTFIIYFGDHGGVAPRSKGYLYETGLHVPMVLRIPENFKHLVDLKPNTRFDGFVSFIDMAPTVLNLAGLKVPAQMDGKPFLGLNVNTDKVNKQDETFGIADRFDEKYDMVRSLRKGNYKYMRSYQPFNPDGLQNNYRYRMVAYSEWRKLYREGKLNDVQSQFFKSRPAEMLFDVEKDPYETNDLSTNPAYASTLKKLRQNLTGRVKSMPDLAFYPESYLIKNAIAAPVKFGKRHKRDISKLIDIADLQLLPFARARSGISSAIRSSAPWHRYWAMIVCSTFGDEALEFVDEAKSIAANDAEPLTRVRAAQFLAIVKAQRPQKVILDVLATTDDPATALLTLNVVVMLTDSEDGYKFDLKKDSVKAKDSVIDNRLQYLAAK